MNVLERKSEGHQIITSHPVGILYKTPSIYWTPWTPKLKVNGECESDFHTHLKDIWFLRLFSPWKLGWKLQFEDGPVLIRHRVRPWLLEMRLHHCMYKVEEKAPLTLGTDWIKHSFMKLYEMPQEVQGLIWDQGWNGLKYLINSSKCHDVPDRVFVSFEKHILKVCHTFLREINTVANRGETTL